MFVGTEVQGLGHVVELSGTGLAGPIGFCPLVGANREMISPGDTVTLLVPPAPLAVLMIPDITGSGAVIVRLTLTIVVPVAGLVPITVTVPVYGVPLGSSELSAEATVETVRLEVPVLGVVPEVGVTCSQPPVLEAVAVKAAAAPPPDTSMVEVGAVPPTV
jgi:hypothetical protein